MAVVESNIYGLWVAKQTAKGSPAATATKALIQVGGDFSTNREDGSEAWSDLERFGSQTDYVNTIVGEGNPAVEAQPDTLGYICWLFFGQESVVGAADPFEHTFTPGTNGGFWSSWWVRVGQNVVRREKYADCKIGSLAIEASTGAKVLRVTPTIISLDPGETFNAGADPTPVINKAISEEPFRYNEGQGTFTVGVPQGGAGVPTVISGQSQFTATWDEALSAYYGDDVVPHDLVPGNPTIGAAITLLADEEGRAEYNKRIFGTGDPNAGTKPLHHLEGVSSYGFTLTRQTADGAVTPDRTFELDIPALRWSPDVALPPNPDGGPIELSIAGSMRKIVGRPASELTIENGSAAYTT